MNSCRFSQIHPSPTENRDFSMEMGKKQWITAVLPNSYSFFVSPENHFNSLNSIFDIEIESFDSETQQEVDQMFLRVWASFWSIERTLSSIGITKSNKMYKSNSLFSANHKSAGVPALLLKGC